MSVNSYLTNLADEAITRDREKLSIQRSISNLEQRLKIHFGADMANSFIFGSYSRGTILPRSMDAHSDVDYMVVFSDGGLRPQSYLDRLRRFAELNYERSEIEQSNPTMVLALNHIRFELVPATQSWFGQLRIPARTSDFNDWQDTDPKGFNERLSAANKAHKNLIKPLVRLVKYWNAVNNYPFESYALEQNVAGHGYGFFGLLMSNQLAEYFFDFVEEMDAGLFAPKWKREAVTRAQEIALEAKTLELQGNSEKAESRVRRLLPPAGGLL